jgi:N,N'-diacetyllegionaminate synthase
MISTESTFIIAEAGVNHNGCLDRARAMVQAAASAGADAVKFQTFKADRLVSRDAPKADYQRQTTDAAESQYDMLKRLELSEYDHIELVECCREHSIEFLSTPFDLESIDMLKRLGVEHWKIPSGEITNLPLLRKIGSLGQPIILSTGMATLDEIGDAMHVLKSAGADRKSITVLHCNTEYPTRMQDVNLRAMQSIARAFPGVDIGYSDHTLGIEIAVAAAALGATVIEKHFTMDRNLPGPDHRASLTPKELGNMVFAIRNIEQALGDGIKRPSPSELKNRDIARKSIIAAKPIRRGEPFSEDNLTIKRPGNGVSPMRWDDFMGTPANRDYETNELIDA